jgi:hypothetical protein
VNPELLGTVIVGAAADPMYTAVPFVRERYRARPVSFWNTQKAPAVMPAMEDGSTIVARAVFVM